MTGRFQQVAFSNTLLMICVTKEIYCWAQTDSSKQTITIIEKLLLDNEIVV
jgi:hypothetical protein